MPEPEQVERFTIVYQSCRRQVHAFAVAQVGRQLAEDVVAETFSVAWRRFAVLPPDAPLPWLLAVARNVARERFRADARLRAVAEEMSALVSEQQLSTSDLADDVTERVAMLSALSHLSQEDRDVLTLAAWHGLSASEAARVMGCSKATYFVRLHRARRRLQNAIVAASEQAPSQLATTSLIRKESIR